MKFRIVNSALIASSPEALEFLAGIPDGSEIEMAKTKPGKRTNRQNNSLHLYLSMLSKALTDAGLDMKKTLKPEIDIPWDEEGRNAKEYLWSPIQKVVLNVESTTDADTKGYDKVYSVLHRHMSDKHGVNVLWPSYLSIEEDNRMRKR